MPRVQKGMKTARKGVTLGNYQEIRLRHMHATRAPAARSAATASTSSTRVTQWIATARPWA